MKVPYNGYQIVANSQVRYSRKEDRPSALLVRGMSGLALLPLVSIRAGGAEGEQPGAAAAGCVVLAAVMPGLLRWHHVKTAHFVFRGVIDPGCVCSVQSFTRLGRG